MAPTPTNFGAPLRRLGRATTRTTLRAHSSWMDKPQAFHLSVSPCLAWRSWTRQWIAAELRLVTIAQLRMTRRIHGCWPRGREAYPECPQACGSVGRVLLAGIRDPDAAIATAWWRRAGLVPRHLARRRPRTFPLEPCPCLGTAPLRRKHPTRFHGKSAHRIATSGTRWRRRLSRARSPAKSHIGMITPSLHVTQATRGVNVIGCERERDGADDPGPSPAQ